MLYKYVKSQPVTKPKKQQPKNFEMKRNKAAYGTAVTSLFVGVMILVYSAYPYLQDNWSKLTGKSSGLSKSILKPSVDQFTPVVAGAETSDPSLTSSYVSNVSKNFSSTNRALNINPNANADLSDIKGKMKLSIPSLDVKDAPVEINVSSYDEKVYMPILERNLGHFQGTSLPGHSGNTFIYGHSINELWAIANKRNTAVIFTYLDKVEIGDEIDLEYQGKVYKYVLQKTRIVSPDDISPIYTTNNQETLTLMTCWPPGIGSQRLILNANLIS